MADLLGELPQVSWFPEHGGVPVEDEVVADLGDLQVGELGATQVRRLVVGVEELVVVGIHLASDR